MQELQVPTRRAAVEIFTTRGARWKGDLFLGPSHLRPGEVEDVGEVLNDDRTFLPFRVEGSSSSMFAINKSHIARVRVPGDAGGCPRRAAEIHTLTLVDGTAVSGRICVETPSSASRLLDKLNRAGRFLPVESEDALHFVQIDHVVHVE